MPLGRLASFRSNLLAVVAACLSGLLYVFAYPGVGAWPIAFVALVPLLLAIEGKSARQALLLGWGCGVVQTGLGFSWLPPVFERFGGFSPVASGLFWAVLTAYQAFRLGLACWLSARATSHGWPPAWSFAAAFVASETAFPLPFPWYFGAALHEVLPLVQIADVGGVVFVSLLLVSMNLGIARTLLALRAREGRPFAALLMAVGGLLAAAAYGRMRQTQLDVALSAAPSLTVGVVQANLNVLAKRAPVPDTLGRHLELSARLVAAQPVDLLVWSESSEARIVPEAETRERFERPLRALPGIPTLLGAVVSGRGRPSANGEQRRALFNSALLFDAAGALSGRYDKQRLLPFAEYMPFAEWFPSLYDLSPHSGRFSAGNGTAPLEISGHRLAATVCYEDILPSAVNRLMRGSGAELLVNLSNDAWFQGSPEPAIHLALAKFRAIEHRRYLVRANNSGVSAIVEPTGNVSAKTAPFTEAAFRGEARWLTGDTLYQLVGDAPAWLVTGLIGLGAFRRRRARLQVADAGPAA